MARCKAGHRPAIKNGFYYDFDLEHRLTSDDLARIEAEMKNIAAEGFPLIREELSKQEAIELFSRMNQPYKLELLEELPEEVSVYRQGEFVDLCQGPHVGSTAEVKHFKLQSVAGRTGEGTPQGPCSSAFTALPLTAKKSLRIISGF